MQQSQDIRKFKWLLSLPLPGFAISINGILFKGKLLANVNLLVFSTLLLFLIAFVLVWLHVQIANSTRRRYKEERLLLRLLTAACLHFPLSACFVTGIFLLYDAGQFFGYRFNVTDYKWGLFAGAVCDVVGIAMNESIYRYSKWKETKLEAEQLSKEKLQTQLNGLLQQINPHFLFNSLNSLSALIAEDPKRAQKFVSDLSKVYRYLLRTNESELTTLATELQFIESYFRLLQTRFGAGVQLQKNVDAADERLLLPPLTLQLLIENAVKHNTVGKSQPLCIEILTADEHLIVRNNLQKKVLKVEGGRVGLSNIAEKYRLINKSTIEVSEGGGFFTVKIPLIKALESSF